MDTKIDVLKKNGTYNSRYDRVVADVFRTGIFFDAHDLLQVKYEMLRAVETEGLTVTQAAQSYGFSRQGFYDVKAAFDKYGFQGLLPSKTGPKGANKFNTDCQLFVDNYISEHESYKLKDITSALLTEKGVQVSTQTISSYLLKKVKGS